MANCFSTFPTTERRQCAVLPIRFFDAKPRVLMVTTLNTKRWVIPKGWQENGIPAYQMAAQEGYEEAGVVGTVFFDSIGSFSYIKRTRTGELKTCDVDVFGMLVNSQLPSWPEKGKRDMRWISITKAMNLASDPDLKNFLRNFEPMKMIHSAMEQRFEHYEPGSVYHDQVNKAFTPKI